MGGDESTRWPTLAEGDGGFGPGRLTRIDAARADAGLTLREADDGSGRQVLTQSDRRVGALVTGDHGTRLETADGSFVIRRSPVTWRGWRLELLREGAEVASLSFKPALLRPAGVFMAPAGGSYKLRYRLFNPTWRLHDPAGELIAAFRRAKSGLDFDIELAPAAALVDSVAALLLATCWAIARVPWAAPGGAGGGGGV
jgi:hypothetical protein